MIPMSSYTKKTCVGCYCLSSPFSMCIQLFCSVYYFFVRIFNLNMHGLRKPSLDAYFQGAWPFPSQFQYNVNLDSLNTKFMNLCIEGAQKNSLGQVEGSSTPFFAEITFRATQQLLVEEITGLKTPGRARWAHMYMYT